MCLAQYVPTASIPSVVPIATPTPSATPQSVAPLTDREKAMLELIKQLQDRVTKLENAQGMAAKPPADPAKQEPAAVVPVSKPTPIPDVLADRSPEQQQEDDLLKRDDSRRGFGGYTPNIGFKLADTKYGDINLSIYTYIRYLNQLGLDDTYTDAFGNTKNVQNRQDIQIQKLQIKFLGWVLNPKLRYFLYAWTSNATQGQGAQVVLAGNLSYSFSKYFTLGGGIRSLPGTRSVEGNFPFWFSPDSRMIADEFMRPSYTSGIWATGDLHERLKYQVMLGNNMSTLGVSAARLDNGLNTFSSALIWLPTGNFDKHKNASQWGDFITSNGWGDFEGRDKFSTRFAVHFNRSNENKESQPNSDNFENTQLRLTDGSVIFTPNLFGPDITVTDARWRMMAADGGFKYKGYSLEGEYYWRWLDNFKGTNTQSIPTDFTHGYQIQASTMLAPRSVQLYAGHSRVFGNYGNPWDFRAGINWYPFKTKVLRWHNEALYLHKSPVGYSSVPFVVGGRGWVFISNIELAF